MPRHITLRDPFECDEDTFWGSVFFETDYNRRLYTEALGFGGYTLLADDLRAGERIRRMRCEPRLEMPAAVRRVLGDALSYTEEGRFDPKARRWHWRVVLSRLADKIRIEGDVRCEPAGAGRLTRTSDIDVGVDLFGVGGLIEGFVEKSVRDSYARATAFTRAYIRDASRRPT
jgi:hypothetical protein